MTQTAGRRTDGRSVHTYFTQRLKQSLSRVYSLFIAQKLQGSASGHMDLEYSHKDFSFNQPKLMATENWETIAVGHRNTE